MAKSALLKSSIAKKVAMALSGIFLMVFLAQHFFINMTSVFSPDTFNSISHFMGNNPLVQYVIQPILIFGVVFHFIMGCFLYPSDAADDGLVVAILAGPDIKKRKVVVVR